MTHRIHVKSTRLHGWDYTCAAWYFVTVCTHQRQHMLGDVIDSAMRLSAAGHIAYEEWRRTETVRSRVALDEFIVMPNHVHGIIVITESPDVPASAPHRGASTRPRLSPSSLGSIIGQFKSITTKRIREAGLGDFEWQPRFYDHIIRSEASVDAIRKYIVENPAKWAFDKDNREGLRM